MKVYPGEKTIAIIFFIFSLLAIYFSYDISGFESISSPGSFPMLVSVILFISSILVLNEVRIKQAKQLEGEESADILDKRNIVLKSSAVSYLFPRLFVIFFFASLIYVFLIIHLSFIYSSILFLFFTGIYFKSEKFTLDIKEAIKIGIISILVVLVIYFIFHDIFKVLLP